MPLAIPNLGEGGALQDQAAPDSRDFDAIVAGFARSGVVSGCAVSQRAAGANMSVDVAAGLVTVAGTPVAVVAGNLAVGAADVTNPRFDLVVVDSTGTASVVAGTPAASTPTNSPHFPAIPAASVVLAALYVPAASASVTTALITDKRIVVSGLGLAWRGAWTATTRYAPNDLFSNNGGIYLVPATFVSGASFDATGLVVLVPPSGTYALPDVVVSKTANYTAAAGEYVLCNTTAGGFTVTLPPSPTVGQVVGIKKTSSDANLVTISPNVDGGVITVTTQNHSLFVEYDGTAWRARSGHYPKNTFVTLAGPNNVNPIPNLGAPFLQLVNGSTDGLTSTLHLTAAVGFAGPYLLGINAGPATNVTALTINVDAAGNGGFNAHLFSGDSAASSGLNLTGDAGSHGNLIQATHSGDGMMQYFNYANATPAAGQLMVKWLSAAHGGDMFRAYADTGIVEVASGGILQANGAPLVVCTVDNGHSGNVNKTRVLNFNVTLHRYAGASGQFYSGRLAGSDTTAGGLIMQVSSGNAAVDSETWLEAFRVQRIDGTHAGFAFFGGAAASKWTSLPADATDLATAIALVNDIKNNVVKRHSMAA